jgi:hypothetical protein
MVALAFFKIFAEAIPWRVHQIIQKASVEAKKRSA